MFFDLFDLLLKLENLLFCGGEFFAKGLEYLFTRHLITRSWDMRREGGRKVWSGCCVWVGFV